LADTNGAVERQVVSRFPDEPDQARTYRRDVEFALEEYAIAKGAPVRWQFTTADARIKLRRLYPIISNETVH
jgi:hypothetical protein